MRSKAEIEKELSEAKKRLESLEMDVANYDGDRGAERYMFLTSITQMINGYQKSVSELQDELEQYSKKSLNPL